MQNVRQAIEQVFRLSRSAQWRQFDAFVLTQRQYDALLRSVQGCGNCPPSHYLNHIYGTPILVGRSLAECNHLSDSVRRERKSPLDLYLEEFSGGAVTARPVTPREPSTGPRSTDPQSA